MTAYEIISIFIGILALLMSFDACVSTTTGNFYSLEEAIEKSYTMDICRLCNSFFIAFLLLLLLPDCLSRNPGFFE